MDHQQFNIALDKVRQLEPQITEIIGILDNNVDPLFNFLSKFGVKDNCSNDRVVITLAGICALVLATVDASEQDILVFGVITRQLISLMTHTTGELNNISDSTVGL